MTLRQVQSQRNALRDAETSARRALAALVLLLAALGASGCGSGRGGTTGLSNAISHLPVHRCATTNAAGAGTPAIPGYLPATTPLPAGLDQVQAAKVTWYEGDVKHESGLKVLAPRGWSCSAGIGADGGWSMSITGPTKQQVSVYGFYNGPGASTACAFFASAVADAPLPDECKAPRGAVVTQESDHLVAVSSVKRSGTLRLSDHQLLYWYPALGNAAEGVDCVLAVAETKTCDAILAEVKVRVGHELASEAKKAAVQATTPTTTPASTSSGQLTATITGANGACLKGTPSGLSAAPTSGDSFDLRRPGNGLSEGAVIAVPTSVLGSADDCSVTLNFAIGTNLGFFVVFDETDGLSWGPFDSHNVPNTGWSLTLTVNGHS